MVLDVPGIIRAFWGYLRVNVPHNLIFFIYSIFVVCLLDCKQTGVCEIESVAHPHSNATQTERVCSNMFVNKSF